MKRNRLRAKKYGVGYMGYGLAVVVCLSVYTLLWDNPGAALAATQLCTFVVFGCLLVFELRLCSRQMARDLEQAKVAISRPLRNVVFGGQKPVDFDPHFPTVSPDGKFVHALDPKRRSIRYIMCNWIGPDGRTWDDGGPLEGIVTNVTQTTLPAKRRWLGLLPARNAGSIDLAVSMLQHGKETVIEFQFLPDDRALDGWRHTFEQWMYEDQQRARNLVDA